MKKVILLLLVSSILGNTKILAQENPYEWRYNETINLGASLNIPDIRNSSYNNDLYIGYNISGCWGLFVHKKPIFNSIKFAIDLGFSADFGSLKEEELSSVLPPSAVPYPDEVYEYDIKFIQAGVGLRVGPSVVYKLPNSNIFFNIYAHYIPSVSSLIADKEFSFSYMPYYGGGIKAMIGEFGVGIEYMQGKGKFNNLAAKTLKNMLKERQDIVIPAEKYIMETYIFRAYLSIML